MARPDIVLITVDSLRADSVGFLDSEAPSTPIIDSLASGATFAGAASAASSHTRASVPALLTSQYAHRYFTNFLQDVDVPTVAEVLSEAGYQTAAFHSNPLLSRHFGYESGFTTFSDGLRFVEDTQLPEMPTRIYSKIVRLLRRFPYQPAETITQQAVDWLSERSHDSPVFLWVHYMDPHGPYALDRDRGYWDKFQSERLWRKAVTEPLEVTESECERLVDAYRGEIEHTDQHLEPLVEAIEEYTEHTHLVFTGDHGEEFREHGKFSHHPKLYEEVTRVPLIISLPSESEIESSQISLLDIVPTVLSGVGECELPESVGRDLTTEDTGRKSVVMETNPDDIVIIGIRDSRYKLIVGDNNRELYDLDADPLEQTNLTGTVPEVEERLDRRLSAHIEEYDIEGGDKLASTVEEMGEDMKGRLEDLGYL